MTSLSKLEDGNVSHQDKDKYIVRFPPGMRGRVADNAKSNGRSMNAEIIARLDDSHKEGLSSTLTRENVERLSAQMQLLFISGLNPSYQELSLAASQMVRRAKVLVKPGDGPGVHALPGLLAALAAAVDDVEAVLRAHAKNEAT